MMSKFIVQDNVIATANNLIANKLLFRIAIVTELITALAVIIPLSLAFYLILKSVNKNIALFALVLKLTEGIIVAVISLLNFVALQILNGESYLTEFRPEQVQSLIGLFVNGRNAIYSIPMVFLGLGTAVFFYLFLKSKYIPKALAVFGIISYLLVFMQSLLNMVAPQYATIMIIQIICLTPSFLAELIIGPWLFIKGVKEQ